MMSLVTYSFSEIPCFLPALALFVLFVLFVLPMMKRALEVDHVFIDLSLLDVTKIE